MMGFISHCLGEGPINEARHTDPILEEVSARNKTAAIAAVKAPPVLSLCSLLQVPVDHKIFSDATDHLEISSKGLTEESV